MIISFILLSNIQVKSEVMGLEIFRHNKELMCFHFHMYVQQIFFIKIDIFDSFYFYNPDSFEINV